MDVDDGMPPAGNSCGDVLWITYFNRLLNMKIAANFLTGLGLAMLLGYCIIGIRTGSGFIHEPFVMLPASIVLLLGGLTARFVLPRL